MTGKPQYDPLSREVMENPFPTYALMREQCPVQHYDGLSVPYYILFRHADVVTAEIDTSKFTAAYGASAMFISPGSLRNDGDEHRAFRTLLQGRFFAKALEGYAPRIEAIIHRLIDAMIAGGNRANLYPQFALPLPVNMTAILLGTTDADYEEMAYLADKLMLSAWTVSDQQEYEALRERVYSFFNRYLDEREALLAAAGITDPDMSHVGTILPDDILSDLVCGRVQGRRLTREEMHQVCQILLVGGIDTTAYLITNCIWRLLEDRSRWEAVKVDPDRMIPVAIEETLRHDPPGLGLWRTTAAEVEMQGVTIPAHCKVQMSYGSANRDPAVFTDPEAFRLDRPMTEMKKHMTFGTGPHMCIGQHLSRLEMTLALRAIFERLPDLRLDGPTERVENFGFWGRGNLPVAWGKPG